MIVRRIRGPHDRRGYAIVEMVVSITVLALVAGVLIDILIVSARKPKSEAAAQVSPAESELTIARFVSRDVLPSLSATTRKTACGVFQAALVTTQKSTPAAANADETIAYSLGANGLNRTTCVTGQITATTKTVVSADVVVFSATCAPPGQCGSVNIDVQTATDSDTTHPFSLDLTRKQ